MAVPWSKSELIRSTLLLLLGIAITTALVGYLGDGQSEMSAGNTVLRLFLGGFGLAAFGALNTALDRTNAWYLLQAPTRPGQIWRLVVLQTVTTNGTLLIPLAVLTIWSLREHGILWMIDGLAWMIAGCILGVTGMVQLWAARTHLLSRVLLPVIPMIVALVVSAEHLGAFDAVPPEIVLIDPLLMIAVGAGAVANVLGRLYIRTAQNLVSSAAPKRSWLGPLPEFLERRLPLNTSPSLAIAVRDITLQARDGFFLIRYMLVITAVPLWLLLRMYFSETSASLIVLLIVGCYAYGEITPSPVGMEGARFTQTWLTSVQPSQILIGKVIGAVTTNIVQVIMASLAIWYAGGHAVVPIVLAVTVTMLTGVVVTTVSVFDLDLRLHLNSPVQALIIEHLPFRPWRIVSILMATAAGALLLLTVRFAPAAAIAFCGLVMGLFAWIAYRRLVSLMSKSPLRS